MRPFVTRVVAAIAMVAIGVAGCGTPAPSAPVPPITATSAPSEPSEQPTASRTPEPPALAWTSYPTYDSSRLEVPLDYANPSAGTISLLVQRRPADDQAHRIGVLLVNPGGPGVPGAGFASWRQLDTAIPQAVLDRFDVVAWDPRGTGKSGGFDCPDQATVAAIEALDPDPVTGDAQRAYRAAFDPMITQCDAIAGDILPYLSSANSARDMDAIRAALGEGTISYIGWSYGTYLGYLYTTMFPTRLRAAVLDGPVDPNPDLALRDAGQARGSEVAFEHFLELCAAAEDCAFHGGGNPDGAYDALIAALRHSPQGDALTAGQALTGTWMGIWSHDYAGLATALAEAEHGDAAALRELADGLYRGTTLGAYNAIDCLDNRPPTTIDASAEAIAGAREASPHFGPFIALFDIACLDWPVPASPVPVSDPPAGLPPILVVAGRWDPATPPSWAKPLATALGTGVVLTRDGIGHVSGDSATRNACLRSALVSYLVDLLPPAAGTVCKDEPVSFAP